MKIWLWLILIGAGGGAAYLILNDFGTPPTAVATREGKTENIEQFQEDQPTDPDAGTAKEMILPQQEGAQPSAKKGPSVTGDPSEPSEDPFEEQDREEERDLLRDRPLERPIPSRRLRNRAAEATSLPPAAAATAPSPTPVALATNPASNPSNPSSSGGTGGSSGVSTSNLGGSFPALPAPAASPSPGTGNAASPRSRSSSGPVFAPSSPASAGGTKSTRSSKPKDSSAPASSSGGDTTVAGKNDEKDDTKPTEELVKPLVISETQPLTSETDPPGNASAAWVETMKIPAGFTGLSLTPRTVTAMSAPVSDIAAHTEAQPVATPILGATFKSSLDVSEKPTLQILKDCGDPAQNPNCDPTQLPAGAPVITDYFFQGAAHQEDQVPTTPDSFEIGTVVIGTEKDANGKEVPLAEVAFHLSPGFTPGKYQVALIGKAAKHFAAFEIVAAGTQVTPASKASTNRKP